MRIINLLPALLLTTTGRKTGAKYLFPLFYGEDAGRYFIVASKGGAPEPPPLPERKPPGQPL